MGGRMIDGRGRVIEVIVRDLCDGAGPQLWYRVSWRQILLGCGYFREHELAEALTLVDVDTLVEVIDPQLVLPAAMQARRYALRSCRSIATTATASHPPALAKWRETDRYCEGRKA